MRSWLTIGKMEKNTVREEVAESHLDELEPRDAVHRPGAEAVPATAALMAELVAAVSPGGAATS